MHTTPKPAGITLLLLIASFALAPFAKADYVELKDGKVIEGTVLKTKDGYWVKTPAGETHKLTAAEVKSTGKGSKPGAARPSGTPAGGDKSPSPSAGPTTKPAGPGATARITDYATAERRANAVEAPMAAVAIWQSFIDSNPPADQLAAAKEQLAKWQKLADGGAEKIKGKWVGGDERKAIVEKAGQLYQEGAKLMAGNQTLQAVEKLKESVTIYPNNFHANFALGYIMLIQHNPKDGTKYFEAAQRIRPNSPEVMANLAIIEVDKRQHVRAIEMLHKAVQQRDDKIIAQNLIAAITVAPPGAARNAKVKPAMEAARLLAARHGLGSESRQFLFVPLSPEESKGDKGDPLAAGMSSGTGFLISKDGLILTNRHVVEHGKTLLVMLNGAKQRSAELVVIDNEQDLALIRVKPEAGEELPVVQLAAPDAPGDGAACTVMGYPLIDRLGASIKITRGVVSSSSANFAAGPDVVIDAKVNPGNSGGPILDKHGNVMAIVSMKTVASALEDTYGLGISAGRIRKFLAKNKVTVPSAPAATASTGVLDTEEIATVVKPATVCILSTR